jgi:transcription elongation factor GreB
MGRYRAPQAKSSPYITEQGFERLQLELSALWKRRRDVTIAVTAAAAEGDRSENAEYIYRKKELREIDRRIRYLQKRLPELQIVPNQREHLEQVFFGAWVTLETEQGDEIIYRIVGPDEFDPAKGYISIDSPMARALLKKRLDDDVRVITEMGDRSYILIKINYVEP